ncbi:hypothetical protein NO2_1004 [Candidatus Termititenax persephonae]|uniref:Class I SAM-dependent methyltransferase n=1 Tax=Candidatus Termititenax persephonae TaxID=2218525 RepID=A0A388TH52_9BACT|nr:hypothetical protein NO2_1004 [Candidatus Termititenax persephonae]
MELGVAAGGSSVLMLNALKDFSAARLYSHDYCLGYYRNPKLKSGYFVDQYAELKKQWTLYTGGLVCRFLDQIGGDIDFCLIDTMHLNPGEILDFLMILPYLKNGAMVVFHDINMHASANLRLWWRITNNTLLSAISGKKFIPGGFFQGNKELAQFPNIGAVEISANTHENLFEIFNLLTIYWPYLPSKIDEAEIYVHFRKYYAEFYLSYLQTVFTYHREVARKGRETLAYRIAEKLRVM